MGKTYNTDNNRQGDSGQIFKRSGCDTKMLTDKEGGQSYRIIYGWNVSKRGLTKFIASKRRVFKGKDGKTYENETHTKEGEVREIWVCKVTFPDKRTELYTGFYDPAKKVLRIPDLQMTANPNTPPGKTRSGKKVSGYFGRSYVS